MVFISLIPTVQSIEVEKEVKSNIKANIQSMKDRLDSSDLLSYLVQLLRLILAIVLLPVSFIISIPGLIVLFFDTILLILLFWVTGGYFVGNFIYLLVTIWDIFRILGIYLSIPIIINLQAIEYRGSERYIDLLRVLHETYNGEIIKSLKWIYNEYFVPYINPIKPR
jgi:hypothetical protein